MDAKANADNTTTAFIPNLFLSSSSGSLAHARNVTTSFAICDADAGVPKLIIEYHRQIQQLRRIYSEPWQ